MRNYARMPTPRHGARQRVAAWRLALVMFVSLCLVFASIPALADGGAVSDLDRTDYNSPRIWYHPSETNYIVVAPSNQFDAALAVIGKGNARIQLTNAKLAMLSNARTGGSFYLLSTYMHSLSEGEPDFAVATSNYVTWSRLMSAKTLYGANYVWWASDVTSNLRDAALRDFNTINNGGSLGNVGTTLVFSGKTRYTVPTTNAALGGQILWSNWRDGVHSDVKYKNKFLVDSLTSKNVVDASWSYFDTDLTYVLHTGDMTSIFAEYPLSDYYYFIRIHAGNSSDTYGELFSPNVFIVAKDDPSFSVAYNQTQEYAYDGTSFIASPWITNVYMSNYKRITNLGDTVSYTCSANTINQVLQSSNGLQVSVTNTTDVNISGAGFVMILPFASQQEDLPTNNWPEPTGPTVRPPEVPNPPVEPTPDPPTPPQVDVDTDWPNVNVNITVEPSNTTPTDYTPWLRAILQALNNTLDYLGTMLNALRSDLNDHCYHIRKCIEDNTLYLASSIGYKMQGIMSDYQLYIKSLFEWLAEQFDWSFTDVGYDDSSIVMWLRRIYQRLNGGTPTIPDPTTPDAERGFLDWLWDMIHSLMIDLLMIGGGALDGIVETIGDLVHLFPLSVPWDIAALLALFAAEPVTPAFEYDLSGEVSTWTYDYTISVDLHWLDDTMATVRTLELIAFAGFLLWHTKELLEIFDWVGVTKQ